MGLEQKISTGIMESIKSKDNVRRDTLRNVKKVILEVKSSGPNIEELSDSEVLKIISKLAKQGRDSAEIYKQQGREDLSEYELSQVRVLEEYLPVQMSDTELTRVIQGLISELGASSMKDMGKVMGEAMKRLSGRVEGQAISAKVKELLS